jgi:hypothetical protein
MEGGAAGRGFGSARLAEAGEDCLFAIGWPPSARKMYVIKDIITATVF